MMNIVQVEGRSKVAQQLHAINRQERLDGRDRLDADVAKSGTRDAATTGVEGGAIRPCEGIKPKDSWTTRADGSWKRRHGTPRRARFTTFKVAGGPARNTQFQNLRVTEGVFINTGKSFRMIDNWTQSGNAHRMLQGLWVGSTMFKEVADCLVDVPIISSSSRVERTEGAQDVGCDTYIGNLDHSHHVCVHDTHQFRYVHGNTYFPAVLSIDNVQPRKS